MPNVSPIVIDNTYFYNIHFISIKRSFEVLDGENAGRVMSGEMERDIIGTYYNYSVEVDADEATAWEYDYFWQLISQPKDYHVITVPYGQDTLTFKAYVTQGSDELEIMGAKNRWGGLSFNFIAMEPQRRPV